MNNILTWLTIPVDLSARKFPHSTTQLSMYKELQTVCVEIHKMAHS